jgi:hypothetical protein
MAKFISVINDEGRWEKVERGNNGYDASSTECCPRCYSEAGDYGVSSQFYWDEERCGWTQCSGCGSCGYYDSVFIPYTEE